MCRRLAIDHLRCPLEGRQVVLVLAAEEIQEAALEADGHICVLVAIPGRVGGQQVEPSNRGHAGRRCWRGRRRVRLLREPRGVETSGIPRGPEPNGVIQASRVGVGLGSGQGVGCCVKGLVRAGEGAYSPRQVMLRINYLLQLAEDLYARGVKATRMGVSTPSCGV